MKKFYAIVLGLALVLALSGIANAAALDVTGSLKIEGTYGTAWAWGVSGSDSVADLNFSKAFGDKATASLVVGVGLTTVYNDLDADGYYDDGSEFNSGGADEKYGNGIALTVKTGDYTYKFSDAFSLAFMYNKDGFKFVTPALFDAFGLGDKSMIKAALTFEGGSASIYTNLNTTALGLGAAASFVAGPVTLGGGFAYTETATTIDVNAKYGITDAIAVTADLLYTTDFKIGFKFGYTTDPLAASAKLVYDNAATTDQISLAFDLTFKPMDALTLTGSLAYGMDSGIGKYQLKAAYALSETISAYGLYAANQTGEYDVDHDGNSDEGTDADYSYNKVEFGASFIIDGTNTLNVSYVMYSNIDDVVGNAGLNDQLKLTMTISF